MKLQLSFNFEEGNFFIRLNERCIYLKGPKVPIYFSERNGYVKPFFRFLGYRFIYESKSK